MSALEIDTNRFKSALHERRQQVGLWSSMCSAVATEIAADSGFDYIVFDTEHAPIEISGLTALLQIAARGLASSVVRIAWNDHVLIKRVLDLGAQTLLVPFVQNADDAQRAVAACRYPPNGIRGVAGSTRATHYGRVAQYFARSESQICLLVQAETAAAIESLPQICGTAGIDGVFVGPSDLAASLGYIGHPAHDDVQVQLRRAVDVIHAHHKPAGILATTDAEAASYLDWGYDFVAAGVDNAILARGLDMCAANARSHIPADGSRGRRLRW